MGWSRSGFWHRASHRRFHVPAESAPWNLAKSPETADELAAVIYNSLEAIRHLHRISEKMGDRLRIVVLVHEPEEKIAPLLTPYLSEHLGVGCDPNGKLFTAYDVRYVPFGVLLGPRHRALWMGNTLQLTPEIIEKSK